MWWRLVVPSLLVLGLTAAPVTARTRWAGPSPILQVATPTPDAQGSVRPANILLESCEVTVYGGQWPYTPPGTPAPAVASAPNWSVALDVSITNRGRRPMLYNAANFTVRLQDATTVTFGQPVLVGGMEPALRDGRLPPSPSPDAPPPAARGWVTFRGLPARAPDPGTIFLEYTPPPTTINPVPSESDPDPCPSSGLPLSLPLEIAR
jgi:hypothetical protein